MSIWYTKKVEYLHENLDYSPSLIFIKKDEHLSFHMIFVNTTVFVVH